MRAYLLVAILLGSYFPLRVSQATPKAHPPLAEDLQRAADRSAARDAAIVVLDVDSSTVLAARNLETAANSRVSPGSTLKPFILLQLLDTGKLEAKARLFCTRPLVIGTKRMDCAHPAQIATFDAADAIAYSCNSYISQVVV